MGRCVGLIRVIKSELKMDGCVYGTNIMDFCLCVISGVMVSMMCGVI